jgi:FKBP-type peptidyl-prolyl cis-trans isomerase 2
MVVGESRSGSIPAGALVPIATTAARRVGRKEFPSDATPKLGDRFGAKDLEGKPVTFEVTEVTADAVVVHLLHPLHDVEVQYEVKVLAARRASLPPPPPPGVSEEVPDMTDDLLIED